jgi:hypothetical protein
MSDETARKRRRLPLRWLTLAEFVGIVAVAIAALGYWDSHRERTLTEREKVAAEKQHQAETKAGAAKLSFLMTGAPDDGGNRIRVSAAHPEQVIQTQSLTLPSDVRSEAIETTGNPRIEAGWLEGGLEKSLHARDVKAVRGRVPVGVVTVYIEDGQPKTDRAIYLVGYSLHPRVLRSAKVELEGLSLLRRGVGEEVGKAVDAAWSAQAPRPAKP